MKLTNNQLLYTELIIKLTEELYNNANSEMKKAYKEIKKSRDELLDDISNILLSYKIEDSVLNLSKGDRDKLYKDLSAKIDYMLSNEGKKEQKLIQQILITAIKDKNGINSYVMSLGLDFKHTKISNKDLDKIINKLVYGKNYSDRIWDNKEAIAKVIKSDVKKFLNGEIDVNSISKKIKDRFNSNAYNSKRLVVTETARVMEESNELWREQHNIEYVMYCATLDEKTCDDCSAYDGRIYKVGEEPKIIRHPMCRCTMIALPSQDWRPKNRLDNRTKQNINYQSFKEWEESHYTVEN